MSDVRVFKLITGEEILAEVVRDDTETLGQVVIQNVLQLVMQQTQQGVGIGVFPWGAHILEPTITLDTTLHIIYSGKAKEELVKIWTQAFSPLALPKSSLLVG